MIIITIIIHQHHPTFLSLVASATPTKLLALLYSLGLTLFCLPNFFLLSLLLLLLLLLLLVTTSLQPPPHFLSSTPLSQIKMSPPQSPFISHYTLNPLPYFPFSIFFFFLLLAFPIPPISAFNNLTSVLSHYPDLSQFNALLSSTGISTDLSDRTSLTILAVPNSYLHSSTDVSSSPTTLADVVRFQVLLRYLTWSDLRQIPPSGTLIPTLFQTTGRATSNFGSLNLTFNPADGLVSIHPPNNNSSGGGSSNVSSVTVLSLIKTVPFNLSIFAVSSFIAPYGFDLMESESRPPPPAINITRALIDGHSFNVAASMLMASGVVEEFEADEAGAGITIFIPTDSAFASLPPTVQLQALPADRKALVLKFHVLHSYYPLGSLESIVNPVQPTLATEDNGAGSFTLNISTVNRSVILDSGITAAEVTQTVFDQNPVSIFGISNVLLPREIFGSGGGSEGEENPGNGSSGGGGVSRGGGLVGAQPPEGGLAPENSPEGLSPPSHLSSPPGLRDEVKSAARGRWSSNCFARLLICIGSLLYLSV